MTRCPYLAVLLTVVAAAPAFAQSPASVPRAIALPDTMGANFVVADSWIRDYWTMEVHRISR